MSFQEVVGQAAAIKILQNSLKEKRRGLSYLFHGPSGLGKAFVARQFAKGLNCQRQGEDCCDACAPCLKAERLEYPDLYWLDLEDSGSIKIEQIRFLQGVINLKPFEGRVKVFVINNCQGLTEEAANCLLKVIEEPPLDSVIILITANPRSLLPTITSRCQKIKFSNLARLQVKEILERKCNLDSKQSRYLSFYLDGRLADAISLSLGGGDFLAQRDVILDKFLHSPTQGRGEDLSKDKAKAAQALSILISWFRDLLLVKVNMGEEYLINRDRFVEISKEAHRYSYPQLLSLLNSLAKDLGYLKQNVNPRLIADNLWMSLSGLWKS